MDLGQLPSHPCYHSTQAAAFVRSPAQFRDEACGVRRTHRARAPTHCRMGREYRFRTSESPRGMGSVAPPRRPGPCAHRGPGGLGAAGCCSRHAIPGSHARTPGQRICRGEGRTVRPGRIKARTRSCARMRAPGGRDTRDRASPRSRLGSRRRLQCRRDLPPVGGGRDNPRSPGHPNAPPPAPRVYAPPCACEWQEGMWGAKRAVQ